METEGVKEAKGKEEIEKDVEEEEEFMDQFGKIAIGAKLFTIKAHQSPDDINGIVLGDIVTNDKSLILNINEYKFNKIIINEVVDEIQQIDFINKNIKISFLLCSFYPFKPPKKIYINGYEYISLLKFSHKDLRQLGFNKPCLCCDSLSCTNNWSPPLRLHLLLDEIIKNMGFKKFYFYYKFIKIIEKKIFT